MRLTLIVMIFITIICGSAMAEEHKVSIALTYGKFFPTSSETRDDFGDSFTRIGLASYDPVKPDEWRFVVEAGRYSLDGNTQKVQMIPVDAGFEKGIGESSRLQPYISIKGGPYFGKFEDKLTGDSENKIGLNLNATLGVVFSRTLYAEARYDYFSEMEGISLSGLSLSVGVKLFSFSF